MNGLLNRPNRHRPSAPVVQQRCLTLKCSSEWSPTATWNIKYMLLCQNKTFTLRACIHSSCFSEGFLSKLMNTHAFYAHAFIYFKHGSFNFKIVVCYFTQCGLIVFIVFAQCTTRSCWLLTATESWLPMMLTIFRHLNQIAFAHLHHECLTN